MVVVHCWWCDKLYIPSPRAVRAAYCSNACKNRAYRARKRYARNLAHFREAYKLIPAPEWGRGLIDHNLRLKCLEAICSCVEPRYQAFVLREVDKLLSLHTRGTTVIPTGVPHPTKIKTVSEADDELPF